MPFGRRFFLLTWMEDPEAAAAKVAVLAEEPDSLACVVDLNQQWTME